MTKILFSPWPAGRMQNTISIFLQDKEQESSKKSKKKKIKEEN